MIIEAILKINPNAKVVVRGSDINTCEIEWHDGTTAIPKVDIKAKMTELQTEYDNLEYARKRAASYPSLQEFAEAYCEKEIGGSSTKWDAYKIAYNKVRSDNPKG
tara:strand:+ start:539 stop:853 length:315 start_codon:yes stop_codon:yes gene_type:complete